MITITEKAVGKLKEMSEEMDIGHTTARVKVLGGGCHGMTHDMCFDEMTLEDDEVVEVDGVKIVVDQMSWQYLENVTIDYVENDFGGGFKFSGPDIKSSCGCGRSVSY